jgi:accessory colonization factor AcfC
MNGTASRRKRSSTDSVLAMGGNGPALQSNMAKYTIPPNAGKVRVAVTLGHKITVWNGKQGKDEFVIVCRNKKQATEVAEKINKKQHDGEIVVD